MSDRVFLEDVGEPYSLNALGTAKAWEVHRLRNTSHLPPLIYVVESDAGQRLLLGRELSGRPKFNLIRYIAKSFIDIFFDQFMGKDISQYLILRGAYPLDLQCPIGCAPPFDRLVLPTSFINLQRVLNREGTDWEIQGHPLIGEYRGDTWLIPDTVVASGSTIAYLLRNGFERHLPKRVYVFTAYGSLEGIQRIHDECEKKGVELIPVFSQCIFQVSKTGNLPNRPLTDLSVISSGSVTTRTFYEKAFERYQGTRMCSTGDLGESLDHPLEHSIHALQEMHALGMDPRKENWENWTVDIRQREVQKRVQDFDPALFEYFKWIWKNEA